jgi:hypothetical protein
MRVQLMPKKRDAFSAIRRFMVDADVDLRDEENKILNRWFFCDALLRGKQDDEEAIIEKIVDQFAVSKFTARNDIYYTQRLFADCRRLNKKYLIHEHLQRIDKDIERVRKMLFDNKKKTNEGEFDYVPDAKELMTLAKLFESYTYTLNSIPEEITNEKHPPPVFQFILAPGQFIDKPMAIEDALKKADEIILTKNSNGVYSAEEEG